MTRLGVTKKRLKDLKELVNAVISLYDEIIVMSKSSLAEDHDLRRNLVLRVTTLLEYLREGYSGLGSIIKPAHRQIATGVDQISDELDEMLQWLTVGTILSTKEMKDAVTKSAYEISTGLTPPLAVERYQEVIYDTTFQGIKHLSKVNSIGNHIKYVIDCELDLLPKKEK